MSRARTLLVAALASSAVRLAAQRPSEKDDVQLRNDCRLAAQVLTTGHPDPHYEWARDVIGKCDVSGGPALAALWQSLSPDTAELKHVVYTTARLRDARVLAALVSVAGDAARPVEVRLSSLRVLASYFKPGAYVTLGDLQHPPFGSPLGWESEFVAIDGVQPLGADARTTILDLVHRLAGSDPDAAVRAGARFLAEAFESQLRTGG